MSDCRLVDYRLNILNKQKNNLVCYSYFFKNKGCTVTFSIARNELLISFYTFTVLMIALLSCILGDVEAMAYVLPYLDMKKSAILFISIPIHLVEVMSNPHMVADQVAIITVHLLSSREH